MHNCLRYIKFYDKKIIKCIFKKGKIKRKELYDNIITDKDILERSNLLGITVEEALKHEFIRLEQSIIFLSNTALLQHDDEFVELSSSNLKYMRRNWILKKILK